MFFFFVNFKKSQKRYESRDKYHPITNAYTLVEAYKIESKSGTKSPYDAVDQIVAYAYACVSSRGREKGSKSVRNKSGKAGKSKNKYNGYDRGEKR